ncbi:MAG: FtsQ-type POTRA domain-containing protein [Bacteroidota bacterium]
MTNKVKISSIILLITIAVLIGYLSFGLKQPDNYKVEMLSLDGNTYLSKENYLRNANLLERNNYKNITLQVIKDRIEKHPYVKKAEVRYDGNKKVSINITEKKIESILMVDDKQYLLTDNLQVLPLLPETKQIDFPIIMNPSDRNFRMLSSLKKNNDLLIASKIITGIKLLNPELHDGLSTVDMRSGGDVLLNFSFLDYPVIIGRDNEIKKVVYFNNLWNYLKGKEVNNIMEYVDLRYNGHVYLGITKETLEEGEKQS